MRLELGPHLVVFCGLPGSGKTTIARAVAEAITATFLRVDTIEAAIVATLTPFLGNPVGYVVAGEVAGDQLRSGRSVVVDAVNGVQVARDGWHEVAQRHGVPLRFVEVFCSDPVEHRRRVETRGPEMPGHGVPTWEQVLHRPWEPLVEPHFTIDNLGDPSPRVGEVLTWLTSAGT